MNRLKHIIIVLLLVTVSDSFSQVGIGTTTPDPSSVLDVVATDKGLLIPRVSLSVINTSMLDGSNTAATGLLIYNTNASLVGGNGVGYYYFNGTIWEQLKTTSAISDHDFYREGTTASPNHITNDIYTQGNVAIGKTIADYGLDIEEYYQTRALNTSMTNVSNDDNYSAYFENLSTGTGEHYGIKTNVSGSDKIYGNYNDLTSNGSGYEMFGTYNNFKGTFTSNGTKYGLFNNFEYFPATSTIGVQNEMTFRDSYVKHGIINNLIGDGTSIGVTNNISGGTFAIGTTNTVSGGMSASTVIGTKNVVSGNSVFTGYASYNQIHPSYLGPQVGVYSEVTRTTGTSYAGYFRGNLAVGTTVFNSGSADFYVFPPSRGTANQIMQTDATGNVSWVDPTGLASASNGLSTNTDDVVLGGTLNQNTTITQDTFDMIFDLNSSGDFLIQDNGTNHFEVRNTGLTYFGDDTYWNDGSTTGTTLARLYDGGTGDDGVFEIYKNGALQHQFNSADTSIINELGDDIDFRIEGTSEQNLFYIDAGQDRIGVLTNAPEFDIHLAQPDTFEGGSSGIGFSVGANNWKIYHSGLHFSFVENGTRRAYITGGTGAYVVTSDRRLKKNISEVESILEKVNNLKVQRYLYKDQDTSAKKTLGFMAQDVQILFPELVGQAEDGYFGLNYAGFGVVAIKAIQEQQGLIDEQQQQIEALKMSEAETTQLLKRLLKRIENLENQD